MADGLTYLLRTSKYFKLFHTFDTLLAASECLSNPSLSLALIPRCQTNRHTLQSPSLLGYVPKKPIRQPASRILPPPQLRLISLVENTFIVDVFTYSNSIFVTQFRPDFSHIMGASEPMSSPPPAITQWAIQPAPSDPILQLNTQFRADKHPNALNLGVGAYRDSFGKPHEFRAIAKARARLAESNAHSNHQYLPIEGSSHFTALSSNLIFGNTTAEVTTVQTISGSGALRVALEFCKKVLDSESVLVPDPTWPNHYQMVPDANLSLRRYRYYDPKRKGVDIEGLLDDLRDTNEKSVVILQPCGHNPTGADLKRSDWERIRNVIQERRCVVLFDMAYQGLASGDVDKDAYAVRLMAERVGTLVAQSYSKNMGLYNCRIGSLSVCVPGLPGLSSNITSQLKWIIRTMYSSPPAYGARLVAEVLGDEGLRREWKEELKEMVERMNDMRRRLLAELRRKDVHGNWSNIIETRGMFLCLGLTRRQVEFMRTKRHIYMTDDSRINVAGLAEHNVDKLADAIACAADEDMH